MSRVELETEVSSLKECSAETDASFMESWHNGAGSGTQDDEQSGGGTGEWGFIVCSLVDDQ
jgi:hypothetical protein